MDEVSYRPLIEEMLWSFSRIETYETCPYKFFLKYIYKCEGKPKFYASYGSFIHKLIAKGLTEKVSNAELVTDFLTGFSENVQGERPPNNVAAKYVKKGVEYLENFKIPLDVEIKAVEKRLLFQVDGIPFVGIIDLLGEKNGEMYIIDHKSRELKSRSHRPNPTVKDRELDEMLRQLYIYSAAVREEYGKFPKALCFNCFKSGVCIEEPFREAAYNEVIDWMKKEIEEIKNTEDFYPNIDYFGCRYICDVSDECIYSK